MSHELTTINGRTSFAFNAENGDPWHNLGKGVVGYQELDEMLEASLTDYEVFEAPVFARLADGTYVADPVHKATARISPHTQAPQVLGIVGQDYVIVQNREAALLAASVVNASGGDAVWDTMGDLYDGRRFFAGIDLGALYIDPRGVNDRINRYLGVMTSHNGTLGLTVYNDNIRPVCCNTVTAGIASAKRDSKTRRYSSTRHTTNVKELAAAAVQTLAAAEAWNEAFAAAAEKLLAVPVSGPVIDKVLDVVAPMPTAPTDRQKNHVQKVRDGIVDLLDAPTNRPLLGENGWMLFNAVGEYLDHKRGSTPKKRALASMTPNSWVDQKKSAVARALVDA